MNAVNLLPEKHRPRKSTSSQGRGSYIVLGALGAVFVALLVYVLTLNSINDSKTEITEAKAEAARLETQANSLGPYGDFAKIKAERVKSVQELATTRFDWERLVRELAHVLPNDVWLINVSASASGDASTAAPAAAGGGSAPAAPAAAATPGAPTTPSLALKGCARDQSQVAVTLVRLRELQGAVDVSLKHSTREEEQGSASTSASTPSTGAGDQGCGETDGQPNYSFEANVTFAPSTDPAAGNVPDRLGGGS